MKKLILFLALACLTLSACDMETTQKVLDEQEVVAQNQQKMEAQEPLPDLSNSIERRNIINRLKLFENENKMSYIYLTSYGKVMAFYAVKGKVTSGSKRLTSEERFVEYLDCGDSYCNNTKTEAPSLDGTYGSSGDYIFFWTTDGTYIQWSGEYMLADQPLSLQTPPELVLEIK